MNLYLFDFDGTLTEKDSMFEFLYFIYPAKHKFHINNVKFLPFLLIYFFGFIDLKNCKNIFLKIHLNNFTEDEIILKSSLFSQIMISKIYPKATQFLESLSEKDDKYIVTASLDIWMKNIADKLNMNLIATKSIFHSRRFYSIKLNCNGENKIRLIKENINLKKYDKIFVFGNSKKDFPMMSLATESFYNYFK